MGRGRDARLIAQTFRESDCDDDRPDRIRQGLARAPDGAERACARSRRFRARSRRQGKALSARLPVLRLRGRPSSLEPSGGCDRAGRRQCDDHRDYAALLPGRRRLCQRRDGARPRPGGHARGQHRAPRRRDLADAARAVGADAVSRSEAAGRRHHRLRDRRADRPRAADLRPRAALPPDRAGGAVRARRSREALRSACPRTPRPAPSRSRPIHPAG